MFIVRSLLHTHCMTYIVDKGVPLPIVQKQVGHKSLKTTSVYLSPSTEKMAQAYNKVRNKEE
jgi:site-specific recombinase XerD